MKLELALKNHNLMLSFLEGKKGEPVIEISVNSKRGWEDKASKKIYKPFKGVYYINSVDNFYKALYLASNGLRLMFGNSFDRPKDYSNAVSYPNQKGVSFRIRTPISSKKFKSDMESKLVSSFSYILGLDSVPEAAVKSFNRGFSGYLSYLETLVSSNGNGDANLFKSFPKNVDIDIYSLLTQDLRQKFSVDMDSLSAYNYDKRGVLLDFHNTSTDERSAIYLSYPYLKAILLFIEDTLRNVFTSREYRLVFEKVRKTANSKLVEKRFLLVERKRRGHDENNTIISTLSGKVTLSDFERNLLFSALDGYVKEGVVLPVKAGDVYLQNGSLEPFIKAGEDIYPLNRKSALSMMYALI